MVMALITTLFIICICILGGLFYSKNEKRQKEMIMEIRNLSKGGFEREAIRDLIEEKYNIILKNNVFDTYL